MQRFWICTMGFALGAAACSGAPSDGTGAVAAPSTSSSVPDPPAEAPRARQPEGWDAEVRLPMAPDMNPDPHILEVTLEAREAPVELAGVMTSMWTYNGGVPGPLLRARQGDRLIVHFTNNLPEPTTIHWHGVQVPVTMDGSEMSQAAIQPGASFTYDFVLANVGTFWYHPHINASAQVGYGLYGPLIIDDPADPFALDELVLVFSDVSTDAQGQVDFDTTPDWFRDYFGREGSVVLINGKVRPRIKARAGVPQRWRILNAARSHGFKMGIPNVPMTRIGGDGGLISRAEPLEKLELAASERAEIVIVPPAASAGVVEVPLDDADRFNLGVTQPSVPLLDLEIINEGPVDLGWVPPDPLRVLPALDLANALPRRVEFSEVVLDGVGHLAINGHVYGGARYNKDGVVERDPAMEHDHGPVSVAYVGDTEIWEVANLTSYTHPFHLHGFSFEMLERNGQAWPVRELKDSVNIDPKQSVKFAVKYDDRPGMWMFHCHILDHVNLGMMALLSVERREGSPEH